MDIIKKIIEKIYKKFIQLKSYFDKELYIININQDLNLKNKHKNIIIFISLETDTNFKFNNSFLLLKIQKNLFVNNFAY